MFTKINSVWQGLIYLNRIQMEILVETKPSYSQWFSELQQKFVRQQLVHSSLFFSERPYKIIISLDNELFSTGHQVIIKTNADVNSTIRNIHQWILNQNTNWNISFQENVFDNATCIILTIFSQSRLVNKFSYLWGSGNELDICQKIISSSQQMSRTREI